MHRSKLSGIQRVAQCRILSASHLIESLISTNDVKVTVDPLHWLFFPDSDHAECRSTHRS